MNTNDIIKLLNDFEPVGDDATDTTKLYEITDELKKNIDASLAIEALLSIFERYPMHDLGSPGPIVHTLESFAGEYEPFLFTSLDRKPTYMTLWMFNRIINAEKDKNRRLEYINRMKGYAEHRKADDFAKEEAFEYYKYQTEE